MLWPDFESPVDWPLWESRGDRTLWGPTNTLGAFMFPLDGWNPSWFHSTNPTRHYYVARGEDAPLPLDIRKLGEAFRRGGLYSQNT